MEATAGQGKPTGFQTGTASKKASAVKRKGATPQKGQPKQQSSEKKRDAEEFLRKKPRCFGTPQAGQGGK